MSGMSKTLVCFQPAGNPDLERVGVGATIKGGTDRYANESGNTAIVDWQKPWRAASGMGADYCSDAFCPGRRLQR